MTLYKMDPNAKSDNHYRIVRINRWFPALVALFIFISGINQAYGQETKIRNLVFEGGGIRGLAYAGVMYSLDSLNMTADIRNVAGTSAGAITAMMIAIGYNSAEIEEIISETPFHKFKDRRFIFIGGIRRMKKYYGWYRDNAFHRWLGEIIREKTGNADITFAELREKGAPMLYITATCLNKQKLVLLSHETYPGMKVRDAVRISVSVPLYFEAAFVKPDGTIQRSGKIDPDVDIMVDGGVLANYPVYIFDDYFEDSLGNKIRIPNPETLGFRLDEDEQIELDKNDGFELANQQISNLPDFLNAFYIIVIETLNRQNLIQDDWNRTVSISSQGISPKIKKLSEHEKKLLVDSGRNAVLEYFNSHDAED